MKGVGRGEFNEVPGATPPAAATKTTTTVSALTATDLQSNLRWCKKCGGLFVTDAAYTVSACSGGGIHDFVGSWSYWAAIKTDAYTSTEKNLWKRGSMAPFVGQGDWFRCSKCNVVHEPDGSGTGNCSAGGIHTPDRTLAYFMRFESAGEPAQGGWRWCRKCQSMFFDYAGSASRCPSGGSHDSNGSARYVVRHSDDNAPTRQGPLIGVHRGASDDLLWVCRGEINERNELRWSSDTSLPWNSYAGPALAWHSGKLFLVFAGSDKRLYWATWDSSAQTFGNLRVFPDHYSESTPALAEFGGKLVCVHKGRGGEVKLNPDNKLYETIFNDATNEWGPETLMGGDNRTGAGPSLLVIGDRLFCAFRNTWQIAGEYINTTSRGSGWATPWRIGDGAAPESYSRPALVSFKGTIYCVYRGHHTDSHLYVTPLAVNGDLLKTSGTERQGTNLAADGPEVFVINQTLWCLHRGDDDWLWYSRFNETNQNFEPDWQVPGSQIRSEPAVALGLLSL